MNYEFHPEAELEVLEYAARYESDVPGLGERFGDEVERVVELLLENPELGAPLDDEIRHFVLRRLALQIDIPYLVYILYSVCGKSMSIAGLSGKFESCP